MSLDSFYDKIYVIHWKPLKDRKEYLLSKFKEFGITDKVEWVDQYETENDVKDIPNPFNLNKKILAVNASHLYCYKEQLKNQYKHILILEDDIDFEYIDLIKFLNQSADEFVKLDGDLAFLSSCCGLNVYNAKPPDLLYYNPEFITRCTGAYIVNLRCVEKMIASIVNFHAIDRVLNFMIPHMKLRVLWSGLYLKQGSENGKYQSTMVEIRDKDGNYRS